MYAQEMSTLVDTNPWLHGQFIEGQHPVRRSGR